MTEEPKQTVSGALDEETATATELGPDDLFDALREDKIAMEQTAQSLVAQQLSLFCSLDAIAASCDQEHPLVPAKAQVRLNYVNQLWGQCRSNHDQILSLQCHEAVAALPYVRNQAFAAQELRYLELLDVLSESFASPLHSSSPLSSGRPAAPDPPRRQTQVSRIALPKFSGSYFSWPSFRDYFDSLIVQDRSFDELQRMHYLKSCLEGEASDLVSSLPVVAGSFTIAWGKLKGEYENSRHAVKAALTQLFSAPTLARESADDLKRLLKCVDDATSALTALKRPVDQWSDILVHLLVSRIDKTTRKDWELSLGDEREFPSVVRLRSFLNSRVHALEAVTSSAIDERQTAHVSKPRHHQAHHAEISPPKCLACNREHHAVHTCKAFPKLSIEMRHDIVRKSALCMNCLSPKHRAKECKSKHNCRHCGKRHHTFLHKETTQPTAPPEPSVVSSVPAVIDYHPHDSGSARAGPSTSSSHVIPSLHSAGVLNSHVILATAWVRVTSSARRTAKVRVLLDQGSTCTLITEELCRALNLPTHQINASLHGIGNTHAGNVSRVAPVTIAPLGSDTPSLSTDALILPTLTSYVPKFRYPYDRWTHLRGLKLADPDPYSDTPFSMIVGADLYAHILRSGLRRGDVGQPVAQDTIFGWILSGGSATAATPVNLCVLTHHVNVGDSVQQLLQKFWEVEEVGTKDLARFVDPCEQSFRDTHSRLPSGRYVVRVPFTSEGPPDLGESRQRADRLLLSLERRLARDHDLRRLYHDTMQDYISRGHMCLVPNAPPSRPCLYLSHHPVVKLTSSTTKVRVVFNASAPTTNRKSLNELQWTGPKLQTDLPLLISRCRASACFCCADIEQMYRQILVHPEDCDFQRVRWRMDPADPIQSYQLRTVTFGTASAPFLAQRVLKQLADDDGHAFPLAAPVLRQNFYVDDCLFGADNPDSARKTIAQLIELLGRGGFVLRKWASNVPAALQDIDPRDHGLAIDRSIQPDDSLKVLGVRWIPMTDEYQPSVHRVDVSVVTKRSVLSTIARLYDPLGWCSPVVIVAKILMQTLWALKCDWDSELPDDLQSRWRTYCLALPALEAIKIPRWTGLAPDCLQSELHGFADASAKAIAAVIYLRTVTGQGETRITLLQSKTRVAPVKTESIPRLELCAADLLARLLASLGSAPEYSSLERYCWTDATIVLAWLSRPSSSYDVFVANRVARVHTLLPDVPWGHVRSADNPADLGSRGVSPSELRDAVLWWRGPPWLSHARSEWPTLVPAPEPGAPLELKLKTLHVAAADTNGLSLFDRFSSWPRLLRVVARILSLSPARRASRPADQSLRAEDIRDGEMRVIRMLQAWQFPEEKSKLLKQGFVSKSSVLSGLSPFIDDVGIIRVGGRLQQSALPPDARHPIVLRTHPLTRLIVEDAHRVALHGGVSLTMGTLRNTYWVLQARKIVRSVIAKCTVCARFRATSPEQLMGTLPAPRVRRCERPFLHCGVDFAGPLRVRVASGRGNKAHSAYISLFVCLTVKAIHLEVVSGYSTPAFLSAFQRFCSRRGLPQCMYSDNGTNFQGAARELREAYSSAAASVEFQARLAKDQIRWHFIPPAAPHFGGLWEAGVKSVKHHLKRILGARTPTFEELTTLCCQIEACLNSRPLAPLNDSLDSLEVLTPGHFLVGGPLTAIPAPTLLDTSVGRLSRWQVVQQDLESFWQRWADDYVKALQSRTKWKTREESLRVGQLVLLRSHQLPPAKWNLGRVTAVHPGSDGLVRVATVRTASSEFDRAISKLALLPVCHDEVTSVSA